MIFGLVRLDEFVDPLASDCEFPTDLVELSIATYPRLHANVFGSILHHLGVGTSRI